MTPESFSGLHKLTGDEFFHFYAGDPVRQVHLSQDGKNQEFVLGSDLLKKQLTHTLVPAGIWQGTRLIDGGRWALMGTTMTPPFDPKGFEMARRGELVRLFPNLRALIEEYV